MKIDKIVFMGSPEFGLPSLKGLYEVFPKNIAAVFTRPDAPKGRGKKLEPTPIKFWAQNVNIPIFESKDKNKLQEQVLELNPDLIIVIAYGIIFPKIITDKYFCLNVHASLLPQFRGASPIRAALLAGKKLTGITLMKMDEGMDTGHILHEEPIEINEKDNYLTLHNRLANLSGNILPWYLKTYAIPDKICFTEQDNNKATYCRKIQKTDLLLDLNQKPETIRNKIRAYAPFPGVYVKQQGKRIKILEAEVRDNALAILKVKPEGKGEMLYQEYCLGHKGLVESC